MVGAALAAGVATSAATSLAGAGGQQSAAGQASAVQNADYQQAFGFDQSVYNNEGNQLTPYMNTGSSAVQALGSFLAPGGLGSGPGTTPFSMTADQLEQTPGYQFDLQQGEKAVTNSNAAQGLGSSGAALKAAAGYATGLAQNTYGQQYAMYQDNLNQIYNRLMGASQLGAQSSTSLGNAGASIAGNAMSGGVQTGANVGGNIIGGANAQAAALTGIGSSATSAANSYGNYQLTNNLIQQQGGLYGNSGTINPSSYAG